MIDQEFLAQMSERLYRLERIFLFIDVAKLEDAVRQKLDDARFSEVEPALSWPMDVSNAASPKNEPEAEASPSKLPGLQPSAIIHGLSAITFAMSVGDNAYDGFYQFTGFDENFPAISEHVADKCDANLVDDIEEDGKEEHEEEREGEEEGDDDDACTETLPSDAAASYPCMTSLPFSGGLDAAVVIQRCYRSWHERRAVKTQLSMLKMLDRFDCLDHMATSLMALANG